MVVFDDDDNDVESPEPCEMADPSSCEVDKSPQVLADTRDQVNLDSGVINHQQSTNINNTHSVECNKSPSDVKNHEQSLGEKSPDNVSDKKLIESSSPEDESPVLGLRFTSILSEQSRNDETSENADEDGDLLEDNLEYVSVSLYLVVHMRSDNDAFIHLVSY